MDVALYGQFVLALVVVLALIGVLAWIARRLGFAPRVTPLRGKRRLAIIEVLALDAKHRMVLVRRDAIRTSAAARRGPGFGYRNGIAPPAELGSTAAPSSTHVTDPR
ncbi:MAG: hypothetical protein WDO24_01875, partial [Pseudomonadota bacterium]